MSSYLASIMQKSKSVYQAMNLDMSNHSILITWLQNRLREYFLAFDARELQARDRKDYSSIPKIDKFDVMCHELKVLDAEVKHSGDDHDDWDKFMDIMMGIDPSTRPPRSDHQVYRIGKSRISLTYKADSYADVKTLHLLAEVGQIDDLEAITVHLYYPRAEKHRIDVHVKVFPVLESWIISRDVKKIHFPIQKCYFGKCETSKKIHVDTMYKLVSTDDDDIMSKVGTAIEVERVPVTLESHRMLLLEDIEQDRFELRTTDKSKFIPYLNVEAALKELAVVHCISWALTETEGKSFKQMWPFLSSTTKLSTLITDRGEITFPKLIDDMEQHLQRIGDPDKEQIMTALQKLSTSVRESLHRAMKIPKKGPICLIHQCLSSSVVMFRHSLMANPYISFYEPSTTSVSSESMSIAEETVTRPVTANERHVSFNVTTKKTGKNKRAKSATNTPRSGRLPHLVNREVRVIEWQNATYGSPMMDAAFLILTSLPTQIRKYHTDELLDAYWTAFEETAGHFYLKRTWSKDDTYRSYLHGLLFASLVLMTQSFPEIIPDDHEEHLEVVREAVRELVGHNLL